MKKGGSATPPKEIAGSNEILGCNCRRLDLITDQIKEPISIEMGSLFMIQM